VKTSASPYGDHIEDPVFTSVRRRLESIKPYLFALVRAENSRAEGSARRALRRLELVLCDKLVLRYEYDGIEVERTDAVCYIATRPESHGRRTYNIGTAYLELNPETNEPYWFPLGRQLAQHLGAAGLADAVTMLLTAQKDNRDRMMDDRHITPEDIAEAREQLQLTLEDEEDFSNVLDSLLPADQASRTPPMDTASQNSTGNATASVPGRANAAGDGTNAGGQAQVAAGVQAKEATGGSQAATGGSQAATPPPIDYSAVTMVDAKPGTVIPTTSRQHGTSGAGVASGAPTIYTEDEKRRRGKRGEDAAWHMERERLRRLGKNPDLAIWVSRTDELSPFDIKSVDEDDQLIYIEVKSTNSDDPAEPFYISRAELIEATFQRSRYYIYRVTKVDTAAPCIWRVTDPMRLVRDGKGQLLLNKAHMTLAFASSPPVEQGTPGSDPDS
jgi:hypothetical protein